MDESRRRGPRPDASFGELPPPIEVTSLFDADDRSEPTPAELEAAREVARALGAAPLDPLPRAGDARPAPDGDGPRTAELPRVEAPRRRPASPDQLPPVKRRASPTNAAPRATPAQDTVPQAAARRAPQTGVKPWPSVAKAQGRHPITSSKGRARTVRKVRRLTTLAGLVPFLGWLVGPLVVLGIVVLALVGGDDEGSTTATTTSTTTAVSTPGAAPTPAAAPASPSSAAPSSAAPSSAAASSSAAAGQVHVVVRVAGSGGDTIDLVVLAGERVLVPAGSARLPLEVSADVPPGAALTVLAPQASGADLSCTVTATGAVTGSLTRRVADGVLDCSTSVADLAR